MNSKFPIIKTTIALYYVAAFAGYVHLMKDLSGSPWLSVLITLVAVWIGGCILMDYEETESDKRKLREEILRLRSLVK